jgi:hypothetical protein
MRESPIQEMRETRETREITPDRNYPSIQSFESAYPGVWGIVVESIRASFENGFFSTQIVLDTEVHFGQDTEINLFLAHMAVVLRLKNLRVEMKRHGTDLLINIKWPPNDASVRSLLGETQRRYDFL